MEKSYSFAINLSSNKYCEYILYINSSIINDTNNTNNLCFLINSIILLKIELSYYNVLLLTDTLDITFNLYQTLMCLLSI